MTELIFIFVAFPPSCDFQYWLQEILIGKSLVKIISGDIVATWLPYVKVNNRSVSNLLHRGYSIIPSVETLTLLSEDNKN